MTSPPQDRAANPEIAPAAPPRAIAFVGFANSGKTELICRLLPELTARGLEVAVLKHSHHEGLDRVDVGRDTWRYRRAGARAVALAAPGLLQVTREFPGDPPLNEVLQALSPTAEIILVEGYKTGPLPKVAVLGPGAGREVPAYPNLVALVSDQPVDSPLPVFQPGQVKEMGRWLHDYLPRH
jgi:molybdopterin-guanine dinucleotide biosynthesis protein B